VPVYATYRPLLVHGRQGVACLIQLYKFLTGVASSDSGKRRRGSSSDKPAVSSSGLAKNAAKKPETDSDS